MSFVIDIILKILGLIIGKIPYFKKKSAVKTAYEEADKIKQAQAEAQEQVASMERDKEHEENMSKSDDDFWEGGKW